MIGRIPETRGLILVAEGNSEYARELRRALVEASFVATDIKILSNGNAVTSYLSRTRPPRTLPTVLLADVWLPKFPGLDLLAWIRSQERCRSMPVVLMSVGQDPELVSRAYGLGANSFMVKPYGREALTAAMRVLAFYWRRINTDWQR